MRHKSRITLVALCLVVLMTMTGFMAHRTLAGWMSGLAGRVLAPVAERIGYGRALVAVLIGKGDLVRENMNLREELERAHAAVAQADELAQDNRFLRSAMDLKSKLDFRYIDAGIFSYIRDGGVRQVVINKGRADGISNGDAVITAQGALLGLVLDAEQHRSLVRVIGDPALEVTARVVGTDITGLLHSDVKEGLVLDLVQKAESVSEGQAVATSGNDNLPAGILIGTIRSVDTESATLFKIVRVTADSAVAFSGRVLVFHP